MESGGGAYGAAKAGGTFDLWHFLQQPQVIARIFSAVSGLRSVRPGPQKLETIKGSSLLETDSLLLFSVPLAGTRGMGALTCPRLRCGREHVTWPECRQVRGSGSS